MLVLVVRHAHAGSKEGWHDDDALRPLTERGVEEAHALVDPLVAYRPRRIVSSPLLRCVQTVQPLADRTDQPVEVVTALGPTAGDGAAAFVRALDQEDAPIVVCTHGETIETLQRHLDGTGSTAFGPGGAHEKGSAWVLDLDAHAGTVTCAEYLRPPCADGRLAPCAADG